MNENNKNSKPQLYLWLKIIGFALLAVGVIILIVNITKDVPPMGSNGWFEAESSKSFGIFGGIACMMISTFLLIVGFGPEIKKTAIKTHKYVINENKDDMKDIVDSGADIVGGAITKTVRAVKKGLSDEQSQKYCKHCGSEIDADSKFCSHCGQEQ